MGEMLAVALPVEQRCVQVSYNFKDIERISKHPRALMEQLSNVETKIVTRIKNLNVRKFVVLRLVIQSFQTFLTHLDSG